MIKYVLVVWPESQYFINHSECYFCNDEKVGSSAYFVPEDLYNKTFKLKHK